MVAGIVPAAREIDIVIRTVIKSGIAAPVASCLFGQITASLQLKKEYGLLQSFTVVKIARSFYSLIAFAELGKIRSNDRS